MELKGKALNLRIYCGESDKYEGQPYMKPLFLLHVMPD
jgi:PII-like signaling protein